MTAVIKPGSITDAVEDYIFHQVNCRNAFGSGVAKAIAEKWPRVKEGYHDHCGNHHPNDLLGTYLLSPTGDGRQIVNVFSQFDYGYTGKKYTQYPAIDTALRKFINENPVSTSSYAFPYGYGCGLGGGDWGVVSNIIIDIFTEIGLDVAFYDVNI